MEIVQIPISIPFAEGNVNAYILPNAPVTLIDTGIYKEDSIQQLKDGLKKIGLSLSKVQQIIITHLHTDHVGGLSRILQEIDVPVYMHSRAKPFVLDGRSEFERAEAFFQAFHQSCGVDPSYTRNRRYIEENWRNVHYLEEGDTVTAGGLSFQVFYVPGHSQTDMILLDPKTGASIVGDHLLPDISANAFIEPPQPDQVERPKTLLQYRISMLRTKELPIQTVYPGHGNPFTGHRDLIEQRFTEHEQRCTQILHHLQNEPKSIYQLCQAMFPWLKGNAVFLGLSEIQGHIDLLMERQQVMHQDYDGVLMYIAI